MCQSDIDKAWHLIHYFLTGEVAPDQSPLSQAIFGDIEFSDGNLGYGPPTYLSASQVAVIALELARVDPDKLTSRHSLDAVRDDVYLADIWTDTGANRSYLLDNYRRLQGFYASAAANRQAVIQYVC